MKPVLGILFTLITVGCLGQCAVATMETEEGVIFNQNNREGIDPNKEIESNDLISFLRIDSTKSKTKSYFLTVLLKNHQNKEGHSTLTLRLHTGDKLVLHEQKIKLSILEIGFGFEEAEMFYPMDKLIYDKLSLTPVERIEIDDKIKILDIVPDTNLLKRLSKCLISKTF